VWKSLSAAAREIGEMNRLSQIVALKTMYIVKKTSVVVAACSLPMLASANIAITASSVTATASSDFGTFNQNSTSVPGSVSASYSYYGIYHPQFPGAPNVPFTATSSASMASTFSNISLHDVAGTGNGQVGLDITAGYGSSGGAVAYSGADATFEIQFTLGSPGSVSAGVNLLFGGYNSLYGLAEYISLDGVHVLSYNSQYPPGISGVWSLSAGSHTLVIDEQFGHTANFFVPDYRNITFQYDISESTRSVPEPCALLALGSGLVGVLRRRRIRTG